MRPVRVSPRSSQGTAVPTSGGSRPRYAPATPTPSYQKRCGSSGSSHSPFELRAGFAAGSEDVEKLDSLARRQAVESSRVADVPDPGEVAVRPASTYET